MIPDIRSILPFSLLGGFLLHLMGPVSDLGAADPPLDAGKAIFRDQIRPILVGKCLACHSSTKPRGGLDLTRRASAMQGGESGAAVTPGNADKSLLYRKLMAREMPPKNPLTEEQTAAFKRWIDAGAPFDGEPLTAATQRAGADWWSLQPIRRVTPPTMTADTSIDAFVRAKLADKGLSPAPEADRRTLVRRVTFDLTGLPPTPAEIDAALSDRSPDWFERVVDRLLASPAYGERWGRHWLDVVRFAESHGYEMNTLRENAWPYRDYVIRAFNRDIPYPQFILEQLAGDTIAGADELTQAATGFLVGGAHDAVGNQTVEGMLQQRMDDLDDVVTATGATFLGLTVNCARCHDHKFDPIAQKDYYSLQAVFAGVQHTDRELRPIVAPSAEQLARLRAELQQIEGSLDELEPLARPRANKPGRQPVKPRGNVEHIEPINARFVRFTVRATNTGSEPCIDELEVFSTGDRTTNVALGAKPTASSEYPNNPIHKIVHINDGKYGNGRSWISAEPGKGWIQLELPRTIRIDRIRWARDREGVYSDRLPTDYVIETAVEPGKWTVIAGSMDRQPFRSPPLTEAPPTLGASPERHQQYLTLIARREQIVRELAQSTKGPRVYAGTFQQPGPTHILLGGDPMRKGEAVRPDGPGVLRTPLSLTADATESSRRVALARWLGNPNNSLTARVMVNRVWHHHFGQGLVNTPSDFGFNGDRPSHTELLDWLASEFIRNGWQLKPLHRMILLSATYRQSGRFDPKAAAIDSGNRLLWRMSPRRLEAEAVRDSMLAVSGSLDRRMGGQGYNPWEKNTNYVVVFKPKKELGPDEMRRMIYQFKPRSQQDPTFGVFDCPDAALAKPRRTSSTTVMQALNLYNSDFANRQAEVFARRIQAEAGAEAEKQVETAFRLAFGRQPTSRETQGAITVVRMHGIAALCRALLNTNEFLYAD